MISGGKLIRAGAGIIVLMVLFFVVLNFYGQYQAERAGVSGGETTPTAEATGTPEGDGGGDAEASDGGDAAEQPAANADSGSGQVVVLIEGLNFREEPSPDGKPIRGLGEGDRLTLVSEEGSWYKVKDENGVEGYVSSNPQYARVEGN